MKIFDFFEIKNLIKYSKENISKFGRFLAAYYLNFPLNFNEFESIPNLFQWNQITGLF